MGLLGIFGNGKNSKSNGNNGKPNSGYANLIYNDIYDIVCTETFERINNIVSQAIGALGDKAPVLRFRDSDGQRKLNIDDYVITYQSALQEISGILAGIQAGVSAADFSKLREYYAGLLSDLSLGEFDYEYLKNESLVYTRLPIEIKKLEASIKTGEGLLKNGQVHTTNLRDYGVSHESKKKTLTDSKNRYSQSEQNLRDFLKWHFETPNFLADIFRKLNEVYKNECLEGAMGFAEALYLPFKEKKGLSNPHKARYASEVISLLNKGKSAEEANEFACRVNKLIDEEYKGIVNDFTLKRATDLAVMGAEIRHYGASAEAKTGGGSSC